MMTVGSQGRNSECNYSHAQERERNSTAPPAHSILLSYTVQDPVMKWCFPHSGWVFPHQCSINTVLHRQPELDNSSLRFSSLEILDRVLTKPSIPTRLLTFPILAGFVLCAVPLFSTAPALTMLTMCCLSTQDLSFREQTNA